MPKVLKITSLQYFCNISNKRWGINMIFWMKINIKVFYKLTALFLLVVARYVQSAQNSKSVISLRYLKKERSHEVDFFCMLINIKLSNVLPLLNLFLSQYGIHTKSFLHLINCLYNISSLLLFQVTVEPCKLACFPWFWKTFFYQGGLEFSLSSVENDYTVQKVYPNVLHDMWI